MQNNSPRTTLIITFAGIIVLFGAAWYWHSTQTAAPASSGSVATSTASTTTTTLPGGATITGSGGYTVTELPSNTSSVTAPNFTTPLSVPDSDSADVKAAFALQFSTVEATLATTPTDFNALITLGELRKMSNDYQGAADDWEYVSAIYPTNTVSFANLGDLYTNFLPNYPKAVTNYKEEIVNNPTSPDAYLNLFSLYTNQYKAGTTDPTTVLKQGIAAAPTSADLYVALAQYYANEGDKKDASIQYQAALTQAQAQNNTALVDQIQQEEAALQ